MNEQAYFLQIELNLEAPVILAETIGARNHLETLDHIPGSTLRGVLAGRFIRNQKLGENAHADEAFRSLFLQPGLKFRAATLAVNGKRSRILPFNIRKLKGRTKDQTPAFVDEFRLDPENLKPRKYQSAYYRAGESGVHEPVKQVFFHMSRGEHPVQGHAVAGNVFTYEALAPGQSFLGRVVGTQAELNLLKEVCGSKSTAYLGRSTTAQYGKARMTLRDPQPLVSDPVEGDQLMVSCVGPVIILNQYGQASTCLDDLKSWLSRRFDQKITLVGADSRALVRTTTFESFNRKWNCKRWSDTAFAPGSVFCFSVEHSAEEIAKMLESEGLGEYVNEGCGEVSTHVITDDELANLDQEEIIQPVHKPAEMTPEVAEFILSGMKSELLRQADAAGRDLECQGTVPNSPLGRCMAFLKSQYSPEKIEVIADAAKEKKFGKNLRRLTFDQGNLLAKFTQATNGAKNIYDRLNPTDDPRNAFDSLIRDFGVPLELVVLDSDDFKIQLWRTYWIAVLETQMKKSRKPNREVV